MNNTSVQINHEKAKALKDLAVQRDNARLILHNAKSIPLIRYSLVRGMSRPTMIKIWGERLVQLAIEG